MRIMGWAWAWRWDLGYTQKHVVCKLGFRARPGLMVRVKRKFGIFEDPNQELGS